MLKRISKRQAGDAADDSRGDFCFTHYGVFQQCGVSPNASKQSRSNANTNIGSGTAPNCITPTRDDNGTDTNNHNHSDYDYDEAFSIVDWIQHNLPCVGNATHLVNVSHDEELDNNHTAATVAVEGSTHNNRSDPMMMIQQQQQTSSFIDPSNSWCDLSTITPCPTYAAAAAAATTNSNQSEKDYNNNVDHHASASSQSPIIIMESSTNNRAATVIGNHHGNNNGTNHFSGASSWLSGHVGLIQQPAAANSATASSSLLLASHSQQQQQATTATTMATLSSNIPLAKPPSIKKTLSFTKKSWSRQSSKSNSGNNSRSNTPTNPYINIPVEEASASGYNIVCNAGSCLCHNSNNGSNDGLLLNTTNSQSSSVGLNSMVEKKSNGTTTANHCASTTMDDEPTFIFTCGRNNSKEEVSTLHNDSWASSKDGDENSKNTIKGNYYTNTNNNHVTNYYNNTPKINNTTSYADNSSVSSLPSQHQQPLLQNNHPTTSTTSLRMRNATAKIRSSSPLFGGTQVQLEKFLSRGTNNSTTTGNNNKNGPSSVSESASVTITEGGGSGFFDCGSGNNNTTTSSSRRKVQWGSGKIPVLITANHDSTEVVTKRSDSNNNNNYGSSTRRIKGNRSNNVDIMRLFATYHEEIVTALIDSALKGNDEGIIIPKSESSNTTTTTATGSKPNTMNPESSSSTKNVKSTSADNVKSSPKRRSLTPIKMKGSRNSPHRATLSTPLWKRNRSTLKLPERKASNNNNSTETNTVAAASTSEKSGMMFQFKTKNSIIGNASASILSSSVVPPSSSSLERQPLDYFHPNCRLMKEKGSDSNKRKGGSLDGRVVSAVGKDAVLEKLQEKLSMLGDIESGKYGKAADMLQSDAVAFSIQGGTDYDTDKPPRRGHVRNGSHGSSKCLSRSDSNTAQENTNETAALSEKRRAMVETRSLLTLRMGFVSMSYGILLQWDSEQKLVDLIVLRKMCRDDFLERTNEEVTDSSTAAAAKSKQSAESSTSGTTTLESNESKVTGGLKLFPLLNEPDQRSKSFLSVSVVNVKHLHTGCDSCIDSKWKEKRHLIRPYIRFALGKNEHYTKHAKLFPGGHLYFYKKHNNSCMLPMPKEEFRWFAGQEDLVVEVRDMLSVTAAQSEGGKSVRKKHTSPPKIEQPSPSDPVLAVVTVPLSSVNFEDDEDKVIHDVTTSWKNPKAKKYYSSKDETSSTNITLPLRMVGCTSRSFGSISLQIKVKVPRQDDPAPSSKVIKPTKGAAEESIEIPAITRIMQAGWAAYDSATANDGSANVSNSLKNRMRRPPQPRWNKKWNPKTKKWSKLILSTHSRDSRSSEQANWFTFLK